MKFSSILQRVRPFLISSGMIAIGKVFQVALLVILARRLDLAGFGLLSIAINLSQIGAYVFAMGLPSGATRFVATFRAQNQMSELKGFLNFALKLSLLGGLLGGLTGLALALLNVYDLYFSLYLAALTVISAVGLSRAGFSLGFNDVMGSLAPREIVAPLLSLLALFLVTTNDFTTISWIYLLGFVGAEILGAVLLTRQIPAGIRRAKPTGAATAWWKVLAPLQVIALLNMAMQRMDLIFVGVFLDLRAAALYAAAQRVAQVLNILSRVSSFAVSPQIARAFHTGRSDELRKIVWTGVAFGTLVAVPVFLAFVFAAPWIMALFGEEFGDAATILICLAVGQTFAAILGPMAQTMTMTNAERPQLYLLLACTLAAAVGYWPIVLSFGALGVAIWSSTILCIYTLSTLIFAMSKFRHP